MLSKAFRSATVMTVAGWVANAAGRVVGTGCVAAATGPVVGFAPAGLWARNGMAEIQSAAANAAATRQGNVSRNTIENRLKPDFI